MDWMDPSLSDHNRLMAEAYAHLQSPVKPASQLNPEARVKAFFAKTSEDLRQLTVAIEKDFTNKQTKIGYEVGTLGGESPDERDHRLVTGWTKRMAEKFELIGRSRDPLHHHERRYIPDSQNVKSLIHLGFGILMVVTAILVCVIIFLVLKFAV